MINKNVKKVLENRKYKIGKIIDINIENNNVDNKNNTTKKFLIINEYSNNNDNSNELEYNDIDKLTNYKSNLDGDNNEDLKNIYYNTSNLFEINYKNLLKDFET